MPAEYCRVEQEVCPVYASDVEAEIFSIAMSSMRIWYRGRRFPLLFHSCRHLKGEAMQVRNYTYQDIITITPAMPKYEAKIKSFFEEHIHDDEEIRYILDGSGAPPCMSVAACHQ